MWDDLRLFLKDVDILGIVIRSPLPDYEYRWGERNSASEAASFKAFISAEVDFYIESNGMKCPKCGSRRIAEIINGYPAPEVFEKNRACLEAGKDPLFLLGGCCVYPDSPAHHCHECGHEWIYEAKKDRIKHD